ncbi:MAG TPA: phosphotransferase [Candidatus Saccharimonadales bacterium]|nr:phosphotransferase [Candidatus Saccharimonadales bacterium]
MEELPISAAGLEGDPFLPFDDIDLRDRLALDDLMERLGCARFIRIDTAVNRVYILLGDIGLGSKGCTVKISNGTSPECQPEREIETLRLLAENPGQPLRIPQLHTYHTVGATRVATYLPGFTQTYAGIFHFGLPLRPEIGRWLGKYLAWHQEVDPERFKERVGPFCTARLAWDTVLYDNLGAFDDYASFPAMFSLCKKQYGDLSAYYPAGIQASGRQVIPEDLRPENIVFNGQGMPDGIIDFELVDLGDMPRAMRHLYSGAGNIILRACIDEYQLRTGESVDIQQVECWSKVQVLYTLCSQLRRGIPHVRRFVEAQVLAADFFPDEDWTELDRAVVRQFVPFSGDWQIQEFGRYTDAAAAMRPEDCLPVRRVLTPDQAFMLLGFSCFPTELVKRSADILSAENAGNM